MSGGKVYLTGGGCGDAGLVTLKAIKALRSCDTVVYDSLVSKELLLWTGPACEKIYVGKRYGRHSRKQTEINALLVEKAREGKTVVRLKGGDPYVFGRGGEEFMALRDAGIRCEVIPGITSAIAVPAAAGIPVTHRSISDSVTVVTGTAAETGGHTELRLDFHTLAQLKGTLVILMGMHHLTEIVTGLLEAGKDRNTPCAIVMEGTTERQRTLRAPLSELIAGAAKQGFTSPAVIVVGAVAKLSLTAEGEAPSDRRETEAEDAGPELAASAGAEKEKTGTPPFSGISVGVTGTAHFADRLSSVLKEKGADIRDMGFMEIRPAKDPLPDLTDYGWLVFTSPNGVRVFLDKMRLERCDLRTLSGKKMAVIGPGTAAALQEAGIYADYMPEVYDSPHLAQGLADIVVQEQTGDGAGSFQDAVAESTSTDAGRTSCSVMLLRAGQGSDILPRVFRERGILYTEHSLYRLAVQEKKRDAVIGQEPDYIVFGSAMGARAYFEGLEKNGIQNTRSRFVCIGEWCAKEVQKYVTKPPLTAKESSVDAIAECLCGWNQEKHRDGTVMEEEKYAPVQKTEEG
ncbi:MAG: uroporphyrinogen-III C-methyltransferase [Lachnospiraceae bacterium]|nr:uroporphyrinogen-III C-methyltransferase [Lachnospiraceae bacterium]